MFVGKENTINIVIYYRIEGRFYSCYSDFDFAKLKISDEERSCFKKVSIKMKELSWGLYNEIQEDSVSTDQNGDRSFNYRKYKENKLIKLIKSWDATTINSEGVITNVPVTEDNIRNLAPEIAELISNLYDDSSYFTEEEEKK
jgi:hypothetical protein